jgi:hypothetical protein
MALIEMRIRACCSVSGISWHFIYIVETLRPDIPTGRSSLRHSLLYRYIERALTLHVVSRESSLEICPSTARIHGRPIRRCGKSWIVDRGASSIPPADGQRFRAS